MKSNTFFMTAVVLLIGAAAAHPQTLEQLERLSVRWHNKPVTIDTSHEKGEAVDRHARAVIAGDLRPKLENIQSQVGEISEEVKDIREDVDGLKATPLTITMPASPAALAPQQVGTTEPIASTSEPSAPTTVKEEEGGDKMSPWSTNGIVWIYIIIAVAVFAGTAAILAYCAENRRRAAHQRELESRNNAVVAAGNQFREIGFGPVPPLTGKVIAEGVIYTRDQDGLSSGYGKWSVGGNEKKGKKGKGKTVATAPAPQAPATPTSASSSNQGAVCLPPFPANPQLD